MNTQQYKKYRVLFISSGCPHCRKYLEFIERINIKLPINKQIKIIDCVYTQYGIIDDPLIALFDKHITGYPTLFLDGQKIDGMNTRFEAETYLKAYVENEFYTPEYTEGKFNKQCEVIKSGGFKQKIKCE